MNANKSNNTHFMKQFKYLQPGDTIGICAPSARFDSHKALKGISVLQAYGFKTIVPDEIYHIKRYLAGEDRQRAQILTSFFLDDQIDGIICVRGGYGAMRILDHVDWNIVSQNPKPFIGFSDATALLLTIANLSSFPVIHGPNLTSLETASSNTLDSFIHSIQGVSKPIYLDHDSVIFAGKSTGRLMGGNISTISHLIGTKFQPKFDESILFLEDIGEPAYKIDRMLTQMKMAGMFQNIQGLITGSFEDCENDEYINEILEDIFKEFKIPVLTGLNSGHGKENLSLTLGLKVELDTSKASIKWI